MSSGTPKPALLFEDLWSQLRECHQNALQELEAKVNKLKNDRCLDAQKLEEFYNRNQVLKEQKKSLEERLRSEGCERCALFEGNLKSSQDHNLQVIAKLKSERKILEDKNRKLHAELQKLKILWTESFSEQELEIIPDSPVVPSSLPATSKLKKRKNMKKMKHVRYAERPLQWSNKLLFSGPEDTLKKPGGDEVLVPETCPLNASQMRKDATEDMEEVIAETCAFDLFVKHHIKMDTIASQQKCLKPASESNSKSSSSCRLSMLTHSPDSTTERSPSLLPFFQRFLEDKSRCTTKHKKEESDGEESQKRSDTQKKNKHLQSELKNKSDKTVSDQSIELQSLDSKAVPGQSGTSFQTLHVQCVSPIFKKPLEKVQSDADVSSKKGAPLQDQSASHSQHAAKNAVKRHIVEPTWSIDPALALLMYDSEEKEEQHHEELADTDCTWVSHSLLQGGRGDGVSGLGHKANDSLEMMFDRTTDGEYRSYICSQLGNGQPCEEDDDKEESKEEEEDEQGDSLRCHIKPQEPNFAHIAVVRRKEERRRLKATTCKECEVYYAHLPEEEKQKKLSACSRHRFLYIPPSTPENFWEVGFPSTQTCIERGYIREEKKPQERLRRRRPFSARFSLKNSQEEL